MSSCISSRMSFVHFHSSQCFTFVCSTSGWAAVFPVANNKGRAESIYWTQWAQRTDSINSANDWLSACLTRLLSIFLVLCEYLLNHNFKSRFVIFCFIYECRFRNGQIIIRKQFRETSLLLQFRRINSIHPSWKDNYVNMVVYKLFHCLTHTSLTSYLPWLDRSSFLKFIYNTILPSSSLCSHCKAMSG